MSGGHFDIYSAGIANELYGEWRDEENKNLRRKLMEPDTPEHIVRDLTLGNISESDAIARIEKLGSQHE